MFSCSRTSADPLLKFFLLKHVNLLDPPRPRLELGTTFIVRGKDISDQSLESLMDGPVKIIAKENTTDVIKELKYTSSAEQSIGVGASVAGAVLRAFGFIGDEPHLSSKIGEAGASQVVIALHDFSLSRVDRDALETSLKSRLLGADNVHADGTHIYYVTTGIWSARTVELRLITNKGYNAEITAELKELLSANGKLDVKTGLNSETLISSPDPVVFGVEVMRLGRKDDGIVLLDRRPDMRLRGDDEPVEELFEISPDAITFVSKPAET